ncbi:hypothetical protein ILYODFUR_016296 [Ilyodon furcidens]|uniref:Uncharacterized protein n=1 Tax=Ilyodon furcidens TaxID=33524 RepID=A0ABV0V5J6_9TELE
MQFTVRKTNQKHHITSAAELNKVQTIQINQEQLEFQVFTSSHTGHSQVLETFHVRKSETESCTLIHLEVCNQICKNVLYILVSSLYFWVQTEMFSSVLRVIKTLQ